MFLDMKANLKFPSALRTTTLAAAISLALLAACSDKQTENKPVSDNGNVSATSSQSDNKSDRQTNGKEDAGNKVQAYIECYNSVNRSGHSAIERYASWVNMKTGPTGKERHVYGLYDINESSIQTCQKKITAALEQQPKIEQLDGSARNYLEALNTLGERVNEANKYYDRKDYKDDNFAKGKQMHGPLVQAMEKFSVASKAFSDALETENDKLLAAERDHIEKTEGRKLRYWRMSTMAEAKQLTNIIAEETFDVNKAAAKLADFEKAADELSAYAKANKDELPTAWSIMDSAVEDFRITAKERIRRVRDKKPYSQTERNWVGTSSGWMVDGSPDKLIRKYNDLVSRSNSTH